MPSQSLAAPPSEAAAADQLEGTPYKTIRGIGSGGMCRVFEAERADLGKRCVVKLLHERLALDERHVKRLKLEAKSMAKLDSPHVVAVLDLGQTLAGATYVAMELLQGVTLRDELRGRADGILPLGEAIEWARQALDGLGAAHRIRIIHRDVKLDNLFLCDAVGSQPRILKVLDFGIAKWLDAETTGMGMGGTHQHPHTELGTFLGTPRYVAPEQASGLPVDGRTDVYSLGLVLYQLVAGQGPFAHHTDGIALLMAQVAEKPMSPSIVAPQHIPPELEAAILKAIAKDPAHRFQSAEEFSAALEAIAARLSPGQGPPVVGPRAPLVSESAPVSSTLPQVSSTLPLAGTAVPASTTAPLPATHRPTAPFPEDYEAATLERATLLRAAPEDPPSEETTTVEREVPRRRRSMQLIAFLFLSAVLSAAVLYAIIWLQGRG